MSRHVSANAEQQSLILERKYRTLTMPSSCLGLRNGPCLELFGRESNFNAVSRVRAIGWLQASHSTSAGSVIPAILVLAHDAVQYGD